MEQETQTPHKRRVRYKGKYPRKFEEKYKELNPEKYKDTIEHVISKGNTPAGMHISIMVNEILDFLKEENSRLALSIDEPDENGIPLREQLPDASEDLAERTGRQMLFEHVAQTLQRLPEKEQFVMEGVYLKDQEQKNIARDLSVSVPYVYRLQKRGIRRIRGMLSRFIHDSK